ncbi:pilus assembly protein TadG-related protein [Rhizobium sp. 2MFCol3.1]|uniref:vWA domain-containing protein n=1 Tax=Rhizobium sp. 2MFCol3.1 TaxID=1246459 RepID=UPI000477A13B|nr:pilus assembly protein TadG-related protein [Rhizobium sp. 2MFCol3.1]
MNTLLFMMNGISRLISNRDGNFAITTAIIIPVLIGSAGIAIDLSNMAMQKRQLQDASDSAALAAATALSNGKVSTEAEAQALAKDFVAGQMANFIGSADMAALKNGTTVDITTTTTATSKSYKVKVNAGYDMSLTPMMKVFGQNTAAIASNSFSSSGTSDVKSALSMTLALDESGSMLADTTEIQSQSSCTHYNTSGRSIGSYKPCYVKKIDALKTAANLLFTQLDTADPEAKYVRTNAIGWSSEVQISNAFGWGTSATRTSVINKLSGGGGTESAAPMKKAYEDLTTTNYNSETQVHTRAGNNKITKYIVLMTDGDNNSGSSNTATLNTCTDAKNAGIKIYSVAFMAPTGGQTLLRNCASGNGYYYQAESMADLLTAFKAIGSEAAKDKTLLTQ